MQDLIPYQIYSIDHHKQEKAGNVNINHCHQSMMSKLTEEEVVERITNASHQSKYDPEIPSLRELKALSFLVLSMK
jgi:hypothetical protein